MAEKSVEEINKSERIRKIVTVTLTREMDLPSVEQFQDELKQSLLVFKNNDWTISRIYNKPLKG